MQNINTFGNWANHIVDNGITFQIPDYQRTFAWDIQNVQTLLNDLTTNKEYFLGLFLTETDESTKEYSLIDGQQRFTPPVYAVLYFKQAASSKIVFYRDGKQHVQTNPAERFYHVQRHFPSYASAGTKSGIFSKNAVYAFGRKNDRHSPIFFTGKAEKSI